MTPQVPVGPHRVSDSPCLVRRSSVGSPTSSTISQSVLSLSRVQLFAGPWTAAHQVSLSITNSQGSLKSMSIESVMPSNLCPHFSSHLQCFPASGSFPMSQFFPSDGQSIEVSASASVSPSNEHTGLISFRMDWLDLLAIQGTLKSLLQHQSSKASSPPCSAFFIVQLSHPYMTTGKTIALTRLMTLFFLSQSSVSNNSKDLNNEGSFSLTAAKALLIC